MVPTEASSTRTARPEIAAAYDVAQDRAAGQILGWLAGHATTRVGPRGGQVQVPLEVLEAVTVRHHTSRAGDPHRHLHLQVNARVFAAGKWRGLHAVGVRDSLAAINGIGHAAVATDPYFRAVLAAHGYTLDAGRGDHPAGWVRGGVQCPGRADHTEPGSLREGVDGGTSRRTTGASAATILGHPGMGRRPPGRGRPATRCGRRGAVVGPARRCRIPGPSSAECSWRRRPWARWTGMGQQSRCWPSWARADRGGTPPTSGARWSW